MKQVFVVLLLICPPLLFAQQSWNLQRGVEAFDNKRYEEALPFLQSAAKAGEVKAQHLLGYMYNYGLGVTASAQISLNMYNKAIVRNYSPAIWDLAEAYMVGKGAITENQDKVSALLKKLADANDGTAQYWVGIRYNSGTGFPKNVQLAIHYLKLALQNGDKRAAEPLSYIYYKGEGVEVSPEDVFRYLEMAGEKRSDSGTYQLGVMYYRGFGVKADTIKAEQLLKSVAEKDENAAKLLSEVQEAASQIRFRQVAKQFYEGAEVGCWHYDGRLYQFLGERAYEKKIYSDTFYYNSSAFSIVFWMKDVLSGNIVLGDSEETVRFFEASIKDDKISYLRQFEYSLASLKDGSWHLVTILSESNWNKLFIDNKLVEAIKYNSNLAGNVVLHVNKDMNLKKIRLYENILLSENEIRAIYEYEKNIID